MFYNNIALKRIKENTSFTLFLISQGISNLAEAFHFIAIVSLLIKITGKGTSASFIVICTPISSFLLSPFAGSLGDRFNEKYVLIIISFLKAVAMLLFISNYNIGSIYIPMLILAVLDILYSPSKKKIVANLLDSGNLMIGNSILLGIWGLGFIVGPIAAGIIIELWGVNTIFLLDGFLNFLSGIILFFIKINSYQNSTKKKKINFKTNVYKDIDMGFEYFRSKPSIRKLIFINAITSLAIASINIAFYSFAFDVLKVTSKSWGIMMSAFYGANLLAMIISVHFNNIIEKMDLLFIYLIIIMISVIWLLYSISNNLIVVIILQITEGIFISLLTIVINTKLQIITNKDFLARITAINDIFNNIGKLFSVGLTYFILQFQSSRIIFMMNFIILILYGIYKLLF